MHSNKHRNSFRVLLHRIMDPGNGCHEQKTPPSMDGAHLFGVFDYTDCHVYLGDHFSELDDEENARRFQERDSLSQYLVLGLPIRLCNNVLLCDSRVKSFSSFKNRLLKPAHCIHDWSIFLVNLASFHSVTDASQSFQAEETHRVTATVGQGVYSCCPHHRKF